MSDRKTSKDTSKPTCSPESAVGQKPSGLPDGQQVDLFGQPVAPAPRSPSQANKKSVQCAKARILCGALDELATQYARTAKTHGLPMPATFGRKPGDLSRTYDLARSLASKLQVLMGSGGSPLYRLRWKCSAMPLSGWIYRLRASALRISGKDFSGWPTPDAGGFAVGADLQTHLKRVEKLKAKKINGNGAGLPLGIVCQMAGWPESESERYQRQETAGREEGDGIERHGGMGDSTGWEERGGREPGKSSGRESEASGSSPWDDFILIPCADGKYRIVPSEPAFFPLAPGVPARVGKLRAYGNSIVPQLAAKFIKMHMDQHLC